MLVKAKFLQPGLMFVDKVKSLPWREALETFFTQVGSSLAHKHWTIREGPARNKHPSLFKKFVNYDRKKFDNIGHSC